MRELVTRLGVLLTPRERAQALGLFGMMAVGSALEILGLGAIPVFVAVLTDAGTAARIPLVGERLAALGAVQPDRLVLVAAAGLLGIFAVKNAYLAVQSYAQARYVHNRQTAIARRLFRRYLYSPYPFHLRRNTAELLRNSNQDAMEVVASGLMPVMMLAMEGLTVTAILTLLLVADPVTSVVAFVVLGGTIALFLRVVRRQALAAGQEQHGARLGMIQAVSEGLGGIKITRVLGREADFYQSFYRSSDAYARAGTVRQVLTESPRLLLELAGIAGLLGVAALLVTQGRPATALIPTLTLLAVAVVRMVPSFNRITTALNSVRYGRAAVGAVYDDLVGPEPDTSEPARLPFETSIRLDGVTFRYDGAHEPALRGVSLTIEKGESVGFVGPTGSGKTTLVDVVLGLLAPTGGRLLVDGADVAGQERAWQRQIGYVPQEVYLTDDTIRRNVAFGIAEADVDDAAVRRAVRAAQAAEFVDRLPDGLETLVGERGVRLSGGQRQRLGIARALYHDPAVLVLDEATSALDTDTEAAVMEAVEALHGSRTILMIAHRLTTVEGCDRVVTLREGRVERLAATDGVLQS